MSRILCTMKAAQKQDWAAGCCIQNKPFGSIAKDHWAEGKTMSSKDFHSPFRALDKKAHGHKLPVY